MVEIGSRATIDPNLVSPGIYKILPGDIRRAPPYGGAGPAK